MAGTTEGISKFETKGSSETLNCTGNRWNDGNEASHGACRWRCLIPSLHREHNSYTLMILENKLGLPRHAVDIPCFEDC